MAFYLYFSFNFSNPKKKNIEEINISTMTLFIHLADILKMRNNGFITLYLIYMVLNILMQQLYI